MDMPMKKKRTVASQAAARGPLPALPEGLLDDLVKGPMTPTEVHRDPCARAAPHRGSDARDVRCSSGAPSL